MFKNLSITTIAWLSVLLGEGLLVLSLYSDNLKLVFAFTGFLVIILAVRVLRKHQENSGTIFANIPKGVMVVLWGVMAILGVLFIIRFWV